jgi:hypothetical protein
MADIGVQLQYFHIYTREFATDKYMSQTLGNSYRDILLFWRDASKILNQRGKRFLAGGLLVPFNEVRLPEADPTILVHWSHCLSTLGT